MQMRMRRGRMQRMVVVMVVRRVKVMVQLMRTEGRMMVGRMMGRWRQADGRPRPEGELMLVEHHGALVLVHVGVVQMFGLLQRNVERIGFAWHRGRR